MTSRIVCPGGTSGIGHGYGIVGAHAAALGDDERVPHGPVVDVAPEARLGTP